MSELDGLIAEEARFIHSLERIRKRIRELKIAAFSKEHHVEVGSIVTVTRRGKTTEYRVSKIEPDWRWLSGYQRLKNGEWGKTERRLYREWQLPEGTDT